MKPLSQEQYDQIKDVLPVQRGNVEIENIDFLNAVFYIAENGCKWRKLPEDFGKWDTVYQRMRRWAQNGVWPRVFEALQAKLGIDIDVTVLSLDSTHVKVHPDGTGALKKTGRKPLAKVAAVKTQKSI